ncbi:unnamed protein product, partial [Laminaria digitata]
GGGGGGGSSGDGAPREGGVRAGGVGGKIGGKGAGAGVIKVPGRRGPPTKFLTTLHDMLVAGNPQIRWERETGSVIIENPALFETETMPRHLPDVKMSTFLRQLKFYGFKKPRKNPTGQGRFHHPECRWMEVSCVKSLLTKKGYDRKRLENAIRNTAEGAPPPPPSPGVSSGSCSAPAAENGGANGSRSERGSRDGERVGV